jgi:hypothetical protein
MNPEYNHPRDSDNMSDNEKDALQAATGQKVSEVSVEPSDGKPPYKHKIKTEAETVRELKGENPITISTETDPDYKDEEEAEGDEKISPASVSDETSDES